VVCVAAAGRDDHELLSGLFHWVGHGRGHAARRELCDPEFIAGVLVESAKLPAEGVAVLARG